MKKSRSFTQSNWLVGLFAGISFCSSLLLSACSPGGKAGSSDFDSGILETRGYRKVNEGCSKLNLSKPTLDVTTFRKIADCFNSNGAIDPLWRLTQRLSHEELTPLVNLVNQYILSNRPILFELENTYNSLKSNKALDVTLKQVGRLLENEDFIASLITLVKRAHQAELVPGSDLDNQSKVSKKPVVANLRVLRSLERISRKLNPQSVSKGIDIALNLLDAKAFDELQAAVAVKNPREAAGESGRDLETQFVTPLLMYLSVDSKDPKHVEILRELLDRLIDGSLFAAIDEVLEKSQRGNLGDSVPAVASILNFAGDSKFGAGKAPMDDLTTLFSAMNGPLYCLKQSSKIGNAIEFIIDDLVTRGSESAEWVQRGYPLTLKLMSSTCDYPRELGQTYSAMSTLAGTTAWSPMMDVLVALKRHHLESLLSKILANTGSGLLSEVTKNSGGLKRLIPLFQELTERKMWDNLLFVATLLKKEDRPALVETVQFILEPAAELNGASLFDMLVDIVSRVQPKDLVAFLRSAKVFIDQKEPIVAPALLGLRTAYYVNNVHPMIQVGSEIMGAASKNASLFETLFAIAEMPEFKESVRWVSKMANDGELKELLGAMITLYHSFATEGSHAIAKTIEPALEISRRHNLSSSQVAGYRLEFTNRERYGSCQKLDLNLDFSNSRTGEFEAQMGEMLSCLNTQGQFGELVHAVEFLESEKLRTNDGNLLTWSLDLVRDVPLSSSEATDLLDRTFNQYESGKLDRVLSGVALVTNRAIESTSVSRAALELASEIEKQASLSVKQLLSVGAEVVKRSEIQGLIHYVHGLVKAESPVAEPLSDPFKNVDRKRVAEMMRIHECESTEAGQSKRVDKVIADARNTLTAWEWDAEKNNPRTKWTTESFKEALDPLLVKFGDPKGFAPNQSLVEATVSFLHFFSLPSDSNEPWGPTRSDVNSVQHYSPEYFAQFLRERSIDYQPILYYYPGENRQRVRLVNSMESLELVLLNADFRFSFMKNFGYDFLAMIGGAWGDEPSQAWPDLVKAKFPNRALCDNASLTPAQRISLVRNGVCPRKLEEAYVNLINTLRGFLFRKLTPKATVCGTSADPVEEVGSGEEEGETGGASGEGEGSADEFSFFQPEKIPLGSVRKHLFNLNQIVPVIENNLPGANHPHAGGAKVLRDLFFSFYESSPENCKNPMAGKCNNLSVVSHLIRLGLTEQAGKVVAKAPDLRASDAVLSAAQRKQKAVTLDFFRSLIEVTHYSETSRLLTWLVAEPKARDLFWKIVGHVFDEIEAGNSDNLKILSLYLLAGVSREQAHLVQPVVQALDRVLPENLNYLLSREDLIKSALELKDVGSFLEKWYLDDNRERKAELNEVLRLAVRDPQTVAHAFEVLKAVQPEKTVMSRFRASETPWDALSTRVTKLGELPEFKALNLESIATELLEFIEVSESTPTLLKYFSGLMSVEAGAKESRLQTGLAALVDNPAETDRFLKSIGAEIQKGNVHELLRFAHCGLRPDRCLVSGYKR